MAWTFSSAASDLCHLLGYHRLRSSNRDHQQLQVAQENLFWTVHRIEKGLSLRLGRSSNIRHADITLPINPDEPWSTRHARIQGKVFDQLYSQAGLSCSDHERGLAAQALAEESRALINETRAEIMVNLHCLA